MDPTMKKFKKALTYLMNILPISGRNMPILPSEFVPGDTCPVCQNFTYECVCPEPTAIDPDAVLLVPKKKDQPAPPSPVIGREPPAPKPAGIPKVREPQMTITEEDKKFVSEYEKRYPQMTSEFKQICAEQFVTFCRKNSNYGCGNIALGSTLIDSADIKLSLTGLWLRMFDKFNRLKSLVVNGQPDSVGETIQETYSDLSNYGIIGQIILRGKWEK